MVANTKYSSCKESIAAAQLWKQYIILRVLLLLLLFLRGTNFKFVFLFQLLLRFLAVLVTASYGNPYILIPAAVILVGFVLLRWYFLKTSREVKRLEAAGTYAQAPRCGGTGTSEFASYRTLQGGTTSL